jgi:polyisoprenoid-binding protein YceI
MTPRSLRLVALALACHALPAALSAATWTVDTGRSTFAVLTHKAGVAAKLAHDHLVIAHAPRTALEFDPAAPGHAKLSIVVPVQSLEIDAPAARQKHAERLRVLGALTDELKPIAEDDRAKIRESMLSPKQLFGERFGEVKAELLALEPRGGGANARVALGWNAKVRLEVRGVAVEKTFPARFEVVEGGAELHAEILGELRFTEFGIEPYTAALGAVKNDDLFHLWVDLVATPAK